MEYARQAVSDPSERIRALLADSLIVWKVLGNVTAAASPAGTVIHAEYGIIVAVEAARPSEAPIRWWVRWHTPETPPRSRPCTSTVGLLRTVRDALGAANGYRLHVASPPRADS